MRQQRLPVVNEHFCPLSTQPDHSAAACPSLVKEALE
jgi:hypothetical protein